MQEDFDYAAKTAELDELLGKLQGVEVQIDEALRLHARGKALIAELDEYLQHAKNHVSQQVVEK